MDESTLVWRRAPWCGGGRPGVDDDHWQGESVAPGSEEGASKGESSESTSRL